MNIMKLAAILAVCATASAHDFNGTWLMKLGNRNFATIEIKGAAGNFRHTAQFQTSDSGVFSNINSKIDTAKFTDAKPEGQALRFTADGDQYTLKLIDRDHATLSAEGVPLEPWFFTRVRGARPKIATDWDPNQTYATAAEPDTPCPEIGTLYAADQAIRKKPITPEQWIEIDKQDEIRRGAARRLLAEDKIHTAGDFEKAAFIFQHGSTPDDFLMAHTLALISMAKGRQSAVWIAAATLDRYLQSIKQPQIYGTQFGNPATQEPYNRALITDALRRRLQVPALARQQEQLKQMRSAPPSPAPQ